MDYFVEMSFRKKLELFSLEKKLHSKKELSKKPGSRQRCERLA
jgi:hypothetical protein